MILDWLAQDFIEIFARDRRARVALWCDAKAEFRNLLPEVSEHFSTRDLVLLAFDTSKHQGALWLKWAMEAGPGAGKQVVVWLPYAREDLSGSADDGTRLDCLLEYTYAGLTWLIDGKPPTLFGFLKKHAVPLPTRRADQDPLWRGGPVSPLSKYVRMHLGRDAAFWSSKMLSLAGIEESLIGDPEERLLRLLADPRDEWEALQLEGIAKEFCSQIQARYAEVGELASDPDAWARAFVTALVLLEVFAATGEPNDFPFATKLPPRPRQPVLGELLRHWMRDRDHFETYRRWALELEQGLDLREWARSHTGRPQALLSIANDRWTRFLDSLREPGTHETELRDYLNKQRECIVEEAKGFWARHTQDLPGWSLAGDLLELVEHVARATESAAGINDAASLVEAYAQDWHRIDLAHWRLLAAARQAEDMELLASIANRFYMQYLDAVGRAFYDAFRDGGVWPPQGCRSITELTPRLYEEPAARRAILVVDALRFDLAAALRERLREGVLEAYVANVPSETYVGMTSLLPRSAVELQIDDGRPQLHSESAGGDLCYRSYRWKLLEAVGAAPLGKDRTGARRDEIHHLWDMTEPPKALPRVLVLFERGVDELGHGAGHEVLRHFEELLADLERAIRKLRSWGYAEVHVVTDHGFVLLHSSANIQPMHLDKDRFALLGARAGLLKPGEQVATAMVPFPLDPSWSVALPPGLRSFASPGRFFHGGATLQEVVIPYLRLVSATPRARLRARALVPQVDIVTLSVKVELAPDFPAAADLFEEDIRVRVFLGTLDAPRSSEKIIDIGTHGTETIPVTLFLHREPPISKGTEISVQVIDCDTGQSYATGLFVRAARDLG